MIIIISQNSREKFLHVEHKKNFSILCKPNPIRNFSIHRVQPVHYVK